MGSPDPMDPQAGNIITRSDWCTTSSASQLTCHLNSLHTRKTSDGQDFAEAYSDFDTVVVEAFSEYLAQVFRK